MTTSLDMKTLDEWLVEPQTKKGLQNCANKAIAAIDANLSLRIPKTEQERKNAFSDWLEGYRTKIGLEIQKQFAIEFPDIYQNLSKSNIKEAVDQLVWPLIEADVRERIQHKLIPYAVLSQAIAWGRKNVGDASLYGEPQWDGGRWRVALGVVGHGNNLGQITLDTDGNIIIEQTTTRQEIRKYIHDYSSIPAKTAHG